MTHQNRQNRSESPTGRYEITVPSDAVNESDDGVFSYWVPGSDLLLQVSSRARLSGTQVSAETRLTALLAREPLLAATPLTSVTVPGCDFAACKGLDQLGMAWVYAYAVWPDLSIMVLASGRERDMADQEGWVYTAIRSLRRVDTSLSRG